MKQLFSNLLMRQVFGLATHITELRYFKTDVNWYVNAVKILLNEAPDKHWGQSTSPNPNFVVTDSARQITTVFKSVASIVDYITNLVFNRVECNGCQQFIWPDRLWLALA